MDRIIQVLLYTYVYTYCTRSHVPTNFYFIVKKFTRTVHVQYVYFILNYARVE
jgi:hypothetical protein